MNSLGQRENVTTSGSAFAGVPADWTWSYDSRGQLMFADSTTPAADRAYQYDLIGNRKKSVHGTISLPPTDNYTSNALNNPFFPRLRSGHRLFQRPSPGKQFLSNHPIS